MTMKMHKASCHRGKVSIEAKLDLLHTTSYSFGTKSIALHFCSTCGLRVYGKGHIEQMGGDFVAINVACLDDVTPEELAAAPVHYSNGLDNDWMHTPKVTSYL